MADQECGECWRPAVVPSVGVQFLPGFKDEPIARESAASSAGPVDALLAGPIDFPRALRIAIREWHEAQPGEDALNAWHDVEQTYANIVSSRAPSAGPDDGMGELREAFEQWRADVGAVTNADVERILTKHTPTAEEALIRAARALVERSGGR